MGGKSGGGNGGGRSGGSVDDVIELTESNFKKLVLQSDDMWLVEFFAPWCGHCKVILDYFQSLNMNRFMLSHGRMLKAPTLIPRTYTF